MLLAGHLPRRREPQPQRHPSAVEDRPRRNRHLTPAHRALPTTAAQPPPSTPHAPRTAEPVRPAQPLKVVEAGRLVREPRQELRVRARVVLPCLRHMRTLPELDRYPLSRGSTTQPHPPAPRSPPRAALSLARERFAEKRASGSRACPVVRRSCLRPISAVLPRGVGRFLFSFRRPGARLCNGDDPALRRGRRRLVLCHGR